MATGRSFKEYVENKCYDGLYDAAEKNVAENWESLDLRTRGVHRIGAVEVVDGRIQALNFMMRKRAKMSLLVFRGRQYSLSRIFSCCGISVHSKIRSSTNASTGISIRRYSSLNDCLMLTLPI